MEHPNKAVPYPFWLRVTELCADLGINQTEFVKRTGVRFATFAAWKTATRAPQARLVTPIVDAINEAAAQAGRELHLSSAEALRLAGIVPSSQAPAAGPTLDDIRQAIRANRNFTTDQQTALLHVIDGFVNHNSQTAASAHADPDPPA